MSLKTHRELCQTSKHDATDPFGFRDLVKYKIQFAAVKASQHKRQNSPELSMKWKSYANELRIFLADYILTLKDYKGSWDDFKIPEIPPMRENADFVELPKATDEMSQSMREDIRAARRELRTAEKRGSEDLQELCAEVANKRRRHDHHILQLRAGELPDTYYEVA